MYEVLRKERKTQNIKVEDICKEIELKTESAYYKKENGAVPFTVEEAKKISKLLNKPMEDIFFTD